MIRNEAKKIKALYIIVPLTISFNEEMNRFFDQSK